MIHSPLFLMILLLCLGNVAFAMALANSQKLAPQAKAQRIMAVTGIEALCIVVIVVYYVSRHGW